MRRHVTAFIVLGFLSVIIPLDRGYAASPRSLVSKGNSAYLAGKYDEALSAYNEASVQMPESPRIYFNKGAALYGKGDYNKAVEMFEKAALKARDIQLEARAKFNLGNCSFREAERQRDSDINKALEACEKSILFYQEALELDPGFKKAAENIEIVRLTMKTILDEIKKQKERVKKRQQAADRLKKLVERQEEFLNRAGSLSEGKQDSRNHKEKIKDLAEDQDTLRNETRDLAKEIRSSSQKTPSPSQSEQAGKHLENAEREQGQATEKIRQDRMKQASVNQQKAIDEMKKALKSLRGNSGEEGGEDQQKQQSAAKKDREKGQQQREASANQKKAEKMNPEEGRSVMARPPDDAQSILNEEKENMKHRRLPKAGGYREVDKDW
jgi:Ca-activated chloride channel family protein